VKKRTKLAALATRVVGFSSILPTLYAKAVADRSVEGRDNETLIKQGWLRGKRRTANGISGRHSA
jgi:hypothetical protein